MAENEVTEKEIEKVGKEPENKEAQEEKKEAKPEAQKQEKEEPKKEEIVLKRDYTIPLYDAYEKPKTGRNKRAMNIIRGFAARHMKTAEDKVKISTKISEKINSKGIRKPPKKIIVTLSKTKEGIVRCELKENV